MTVTLGKLPDNKGFSPTPAEVLFADLDLDRATTLVHENEPFSGGSFLEMAISGHMSENK